MKSELDIPMPEIPGYVPPSESDKRKSENETSHVSPQGQASLTHDELLRHRASHANLYQLPSWQQNTYTVNMMCAPNPNSPSPQAFPNNELFGNLLLQHRSQVPLNPPPAAPPPFAPSLLQNFPLQQPFQPQPSFPQPQSPPVEQHSPVQTPPPPQKQMYAGRVDPHRPAYPPGTNWMEAQWLQPEVPKDGGFALFGETLLCPLKVTILILQEIFHRNR